MKSVELAFYKSVSVDANIAKKKYEDFHLIKKQIVLQNIPAYSPKEVHVFEYPVAELVGPDEYSVHTDLIKCQFMVGMTAKTAFGFLKSGKIKKAALWFTVEPHNSM